MKNKNQNHLNLTAGSQKRWSIILLSTSLVSVLLIIYSYFIEKYEDSVSVYYIGIFLMVFSIGFLIPNAIHFFSEKKKWETYCRMEECIENYVDLVGKKCKVILIEKYTKQYQVYFECEGKRYMTCVGLSQLDKSFNERRLLVSDDFVLLLNGFKNVIVHSPRFESLDPKYVKIYTYHEIHYVENQKGKSGENLLPVRICL